MNPAYINADLRRVEAIGVIDPSDPNVVFNLRVRLDNFTLVLLATGLFLGPGGSLLESVRSLTA